MYIWSKTHFLRFPHKAWGEGIAYYDQGVFFCLETCLLISSSPSAFQICFWVPSKFFQNLSDFDFASQCIIMKKTIIILIWRLQNEEHENFCYLLSKIGKIRFSQADTERVVKTIWKIEQRFSNFTEIDEAKGKRDRAKQEIFYMKILLH